MKSVMKIVCFLELLLVLVVMISCSIETYYTKKINADNEILSYVNENQYDVYGNVRKGVFSGGDRADGRGLPDGWDRLDR